MDRRCLEKSRLFNLDFSAVCKPKAVELITRAAMAGEICQVVTPNVDHVMLARDYPELVEVFNGARYQVVDGMPLVWMSRILCPNPLPERIAGSDLFVEICRRAAERGISVYLLGAEPEVSFATRQKLEMEYPGIRIVGAHSPPVRFENSKADNRAVIEAIRAANPDIVFVAFGAPRQEMWIAEHLDQFEKGVFVGIGGAFDMFAGRVRRAPKWMQRAGLEWFWRLCLEPRRLWRRYILRDMRILPWFFAEWCRVRRQRRSH